MVNKQVRSLKKVNILNSKNLKENYYHYVWFT